MCLSPSGCFAELILTAYLFCWFCPIYLLSLSHSFFGYLHLLLCAHCWKLQECLCTWVKASITSILLFTPWLTLLPCLPLPELALMIKWAIWAFYSVPCSRTTCWPKTTLVLDWMYCSKDVNGRRWPSFLYWAREKAAPAVATAVMCGAVSWNPL